MALEEFLDLQRVISQRFGGSVDCSQPAADDHYRQPQLHIGNGVVLGRTSELQGHQKIRRRTHTTHQAVGHVEHGRAAGTDRQCNVVKAQRKRILGSHRATETHATEQRKLLLALKKQPDDF